NSASASTSVSALSTDLSVAKTGPASTTTGGPLTYTVTANNNGPDPATGVTVSDTLPTGVTFVSASAGCTNNPGTVTCSVAGSLASGASATFTINATAPAAAGTVTNTATVTGNESDPNAANNSASASTTVTASADVAVTKTGPASTTAGSPITY